MLKVGTLIQVKTKTKDNTFGEVVYEITEIGLSFNKKFSDGVKAVMLGGNGPSARKGYTVFDSEAVIQGNIKDGITKIIPENKVASIKAFYNR